MLKIHATRIEAPNVTQQYGTKWQVVVTDTDNGDAFCFDRVVVLGTVNFHALPDGDEQPRVYATPGERSEVLGYKAGEMYPAFQRRV